MRRNRRRFARNWLSIRHIAADSMDDGLEARSASKGNTLGILARAAGFNPLVDFYLSYVFARYFGFFTGSPES
jgi:hypothetical protein